MKFSFLAVVLLALATITPMAQAETQTFPINKTFTFDGLTVNLSGTITIDTTAETVSGSLTITVTNDTSRQTVFSKTITFIQPFVANGQVTSVLAIPTFPTVLAVSCFTNTAVPSTNCMLSRDPDINQDGAINIIDLVGVARTFSTTFRATDLNGDGTVNILDIIMVAIEFGAPVFA